MLLIAVLNGVCVWVSSGGEILDQKNIRPSILVSVRTEGSVQFKKLRPIDDTTLIFSESIYL